MVVLKTSKLFSGMVASELEVLEHTAQVKSYKAGRNIFQEGDPGDGLYLILEGKVQITCLLGQDQRTVLSQLDAGDFFGEMALLGDSSRSATAVAREQSELIGFFHPDLLEIINFHPVMGAKVTFGLARTLSERLRYTNTQLREIWEIRGSREEPVR